MHLDLEHIYGCDTKTLLVVLMDRDYLQRKYDAMGPEPVEFVEYEQSGERFRAMLRRRLPGISSRDVPRVARRFVRDSYTLLVTLEWQLGEAEDKNGRMSMWIQDMPVKIEGNMQLRSAESGCVKAYQLHIQSSIPVLGRRVEQEAEKLVRRALEKDYAFTQQYLSE